MNNIITDVKNAVENSIDSFYSDDSKHLVMWSYWYDTKNDTTYDAWVCITHDKLYYGDCAQKG